MSALMKTHLTEVKVGKKKFKIPREKESILLSIVESFSKPISADVVFKEVARGRPKYSVYLRGIRQREGLNQSELERLANLPSGIVSKYENGLRKIPKDVALRISKVLKANLDLLLEI